MGCEHIARDLCITLSDIVAMASGCELTCFIIRKLALMYVGVTVSSSCIFHSQKPPKSTFPGL